jgi:hypothetical protein
VERGNGDQPEAIHRLHRDQKDAHAKAIGDPAHRNAGQGGAREEARRQRADLLAAEVEGVAQERGHGPHAEHHERGDKLGQERQGEDHAGAGLGR